MIFILTLTVLIINKYSEIEFFIFTSFNTIEENELLEKVRIYKLASIESIVIFEILNSNESLINSQ